MSDTALDTDTARSDGGPIGPPISLVGPTASGKSEMAMQLALERPGTEIVSVDSMGVYREMDIGTAKPSQADRAEVPHHLLDLVGPEEEFTVRRFQAAAAEALADVEARGGRALLVGGTGLYHRAVVDGLRLPGRWPVVAAALEEEADDAGGLDRLHRRLRREDPLAAGRIEPGNRRRIVRALEVTLGSGRPFSSFGPGLGTYPTTRFVLAGVPFDAGVHGGRVEERLSAQMAAGFLDEVRALAARPAGLSRTARQALGYRELLAHVEEGAPIDDAVAETLRRTRLFARRQWAWFRRDPRVVWLPSASDCYGALLALWDATAAAHQAAARD